MISEESWARIYLILEEAVPLLRHRPNTPKAQSRVKKEVIKRLNAQCPDIVDKLEITVGPSAVDPNTLEIYVASKAS